MSNTRFLVEEFSGAMEHKFRVSAHKHPIDGPDGWRTVNTEVLLIRIHQELKELEEAVMTGLSSEEVLYEAADVANCALMVADNYRSRESGDAKST